MWAISSLTIKTVTTLNSNSQQSPSLALPLKSPPDPAPQASTGAPTCLRVRGARGSVLVTWPVRSGRTARHPPVLRSPRPRARVCRPQVSPIPPVSCDVLQFAPRGEGDMEEPVPSPFRPLWSPRADEMATLGLSKVFILDKYFTELQKFWETEKKLQGVCSRKCACVCEWVCRWTGMRGSLLRELWRGTLAVVDECVSETTFCLLLQSWSRVCLRKARFSFSS